MCRPFAPILGIDPRKRLTSDLWELSHTVGKDFRESGNNDNIPNTNERKYY